MIDPTLNKFSEFMQSFNNFAQQFKVQNKNVSPKEKVQELLNSGQMSQQDFNALREIANQITGKNY